MGFKLAAKTPTVFSLLPIRIGLSFWSLSRIQTPRRPFSGTFIYSAPPEDPEALERKKREKKREAGKRWRTATKEDPERNAKYKEKQRETHRIRRAAEADLSPEALAELKEKRRRYSLTWRVQAKADPERYAKLRKKKREWGLKHWNALKEGEDSETYKAALEYLRRDNGIKWAKDREHRKTKWLRGWVTSLNPIHLAEATWTSHEPAFSPEKIERKCSTCGRTRDGGLKLWWRRLSPQEPTEDGIPPQETTGYDCHECFSKDWPEVGMPENYKYRTCKSGRKRLTKIR